MKRREQLTKWAVGVLGVVCLVLFVNLVRGFKQARAGTSGTASPAGVAARTTQARNEAPAGVSGLSRYDPELNLELLKKVQSRSLSPVGRDPFVFQSPTPPRPAGSAAPQAAPEAPAPPPPSPLKAMGYSEMPGGVREAYVSYEDQVYSVQEGDTIASKFKVLKVSPTQVEVEDASSKEKLKLPITQ
jgi:hypothetical protein